MEDIDIDRATGSMLRRLYRREIDERAGCQMRGILEQRITLQRVETVGVSAGRW